MSLLSGHDARSGGAPASGGNPNREPIVIDLVDAIVSGRIEVGGALPTEQELVHQYGASRTVIREVMLELAKLGLVITRRRIGTRVQPRQVWDRLAPLVLEAELRHGLDAALYEPLIEARNLIEPEVAAMAALRATPDDIEHIKTAFEVLENMAQPTPDERIQADIAFHRAVLSASGNWVFQRFGVLFEAAIVARMRLALQSETVVDPPYALSKHRRIVEAIVDRNPGEARAATLSVLALSKPAYAAYFEEETAEPQE